MLEQVLWLAPTRVCRYQLGIVQHRISGVEPTSAMYMSIDVLGTSDT